VTVPADNRCALRSEPVKATANPLRCARGNLPPFTSLRLPKIYNLRTDPYERADITSNTYYDWLLDHAFLIVPAQDYVGKLLATLKDYPPRQKAASFNLDEVMKMMTEPTGQRQASTDIASICGRPCLSWSAALVSA
jgi:hypothetical protein